MHQNFRKPASIIKAHQILALNRGEKHDLLKVDVEVDHEKLLWVVREHFKTSGSSHKEKQKVHDIIDTALKDSLDRLLLPSLKRELRSNLNERAENQAISVFARNIEKVLLAPPIRYVLFPRIFILTQRSP